MARARRGPGNGKLRPGIPPGLQSWRRRLPHPLFQAPRGTARRRRAGGQRYRGVADDDGAGRRALPPAGTMEAFAMTVYRPGAGQRIFSLPLPFSVLALTVFLAPG